MYRLQSAVAGALLFATMACGAGNDLLIHTPMVMTHDAGTGYLSPGSFVKKLVYDWSATQNVGFYEQMQCGARAIDLRPKLTKDGEVVMHHGDITVPTNLSVALQDVQRFVNENPTELAVFVMTACETDKEGGDCTTSVTALAASMGIKAVTSCNDLATLTMPAAKTLGQQAGGGAVLLVAGCTQSNYDPSVSCYNQKSQAQANGFGPACYGWSSYHDAAFNKMWTYLNQTADKPWPASSFTQMQALWQEDAAGVVEGTLLGSSLVEDEQRSALNAEVLKRLQEGWWPHVGLLEVNNVCDGGNDLRKALLSRGAH